LIFSLYSIIDHHSFLKQGEYRERPLILLPASASELVRLFKDVPKLYFSLRIKATAIWEFPFKVTNCAPQNHRKWCKDTVSEGFDRVIYFRYKNIKKEIENDDKRRNRKKASLVVNGEKYP
jgi:hypothetical protein